MRGSARLLRLRKDDPDAAERERIEQLLEEYYAYVREQFTLFLNSVRDPAVLAAVQEAIADGRITDAFEIVDSYVVRLGDTIVSRIPDIGQQEAQALAAQSGVAGSGVAVSFNPTSPDVIAAMERNRLDFIQDFTADQRIAVNQALQQALRDGLGTEAAARSFRDALGLTSYQQGMVDNYRTLLETNNSRALDSMLRDRRYDRGLENAIEADEVLPDERIDLMVDRYRERLLQMRAETISRTESHRVVEETRNITSYQVADRAGIPYDQVVKQWTSTKDDDRVRDTHEDMNGQARLLEDAFDSPSGAELQFPGDSSAPAAEVINCLLPRSEVHAPDLIATLRAHYHGEAVRIVTAKGTHLSVSANHPVLTMRGWVPACVLNESDYLVCARGFDSPFAVQSGNDAEHVPTLIEQVHESGAVSVLSKVVMAVNLHGDVINGEVDVVLQAGCLLFGTQASLLQQLLQVPLLSGAVRELLTLGNRLGNSGIKAIFAATPRVVGGGDLLQPALLTELGIFDNLCFALRAWPHAEAYELACDHRSAHLVALGQLVNGGTGFVALDKVVDVRTFPFSGHVYSPQTVSGLYAVQGGVLNHNCRCTVMNHFFATRAEAVAFLLENGQGRYDDELDYDDA